LNEKLLKQFVEWSVKTDFSNGQLAKLANSLMAFYFEQRLVEERFTQTHYDVDVVENLHITLDPRDCNKLNIDSTSPPKNNSVNFENQGIIDGYILWHFLDRYLRFQKIYLTLLESGLLPL